MKAKILVVDDSREHVELLEAFLATAEYGTVRAFSGLDALSKLESERPDLVLLDIMMTGMDGYEVCARIKNKADTYPVPVVMITALRDLDEKVRAIDCGADDFLTKPVTRLELISRINSLLRIKHLHDALQEEKAELARTRADFENLAISVKSEVQALLDSKMKNGPEHTKLRREILNILEKLQT
ncbi:MAG: response regulator [Armatimonadetes bacterium]|nr:response regulator [Armatimonadota bacterium]